MPYQEAEAALKNFVYDDIINQTRKMFLLFVPRFLANSNANFTSQFTYSPTTKKAKIKISLSNGKKTLRR